MRAARHLMARPLLAALIAACSTAALAPAAFAQAQDPYAPYVPPAPAPAPAPGPAPAPAPKPDKTGPRLTKVVLTPKVTRAARGIALRFTLDEAARVAGEVMLRRPGMRARGGRCVKPVGKLRGRSCTRWKRAGTVVVARAARGENRARIDLRALAAGPYTLVLTPTDTAGNKGKARTTTFRVRR